MWIEVLIAAVIGGCPSIQVSYHEDEGFTNTDHNHMRSAEMGCERVMQNDSICLKKFRKVTNGNYNAVCGKISNDDDVSHPKHDELCKGCHGSK